MTPQIIDQSIPRQTRLAIQATENLKTVESAEKALTTLGQRFAREGDVLKVQLPDGKTVAKIVPLVVMSFCLMACNPTINVTVRQIVEPPIEPVIEVTPVPFLTEPRVQLRDLPETL